MKTRFLTAAILLFSILACNKDKFQTTPSLEVKGVNTKEVGPSGKLVIRLNYTDKEGDLGDGTLTYIRVRTNIIPIPNPGLYDKIDTVHTAIPGFPTNTSGEINVDVPYNFMDEDPNRNDTMYFKVTIKDIKGNSSDTVSTTTVVAKQN